MGLQGTKAKHSIGVLEHTSLTFLNEHATQRNVSYQMSV